MDITLAVFMEHYISVHIPNSCGGELFVNGVSAPVHSISILLDAHNGNHILSADLQGAGNYTTSDELELKITRDGIRFRVQLESSVIAVPTATILNMKLADPKDLSILLEHLQSRVSHLRKSLLEK
jgi:hypothetical protein